MKNQHVNSYVNRFGGDDVETTPLVLNTAVGPLTLGGSAGAAAEHDMTNRTGKPILIDAIKVQCGLYDGNSSATTSNVFNDLASSLPPITIAGQTLPDDAFLLTECPLRVLQARFTLGGIQLTRDYISVYGMGGSWDLRSSALVSVWQPPAPIYVEHGEQLKCDLRYPNYSAPAIVGGGNVLPNVKPQLTYACRVLEDPADWLKPDEARLLPYATTFAPTPLAQYAAANVQSSDSDLMNATDADLYVYAFVGNCVTQIFDALVGNLDGTLQNAGGNAPTGPLANIPERGIQVRMEKSNGLSIVKDKTPFSHLFSAVDSVWWVNTKLKPREFFRVYLDVDFTDGTAFMNDGSTISPTVTMHGMFWSRGFGAHTKWAQGSRDAELAEFGQRVGIGGLMPGGR